MSITSGSQWVECSYSWRWKYFSVCDWVALVMNLLDSQAGIPVCVLWQNMLLSQFLPPLKMWNGFFGNWKRWIEDKHLIQWEPICMLQWRLESPLQWAFLLECRLHLNLFFFLQNQQGMHQNINVNIVPVTTNAHLDTDRPMMRRPLETVTCFKVGVKLL